MARLIKTPLLEWESVEPTIPFKRSWRAFNGVLFIYVHQHEDDRYHPTDGMSSHDLTEAQALAESLSLGMAKSIVDFFKKRKREARAR